MCNTRGCGEGNKGPGGQPCISEENMKTIKKEESRLWNNFISYVLALYTVNPVSDQLHMCMKKDCR